MKTCLDREGSVTNKSGDNVNPIPTEGYLIIKLWFIQECSTCTGSYMTDSGHWM